MLAPAHFAADRPPLPAETFARRSAAILQTTTINMVVSNQRAQSCSVAFFYERGCCCSLLFGSRRFFFNHDPPNDIVCFVALLNWTGKRYVCKTTSILFASADQKCSVMTEKNFSSQDLVRFRKVKKRNFSSQTDSITATYFFLVPG